MCNHWRRQMGKIRGLNENLRISASWRDKTKYVAYCSVFGPIGYGDTAETAIAALKVKLHEDIDRLKSSLYKANGSLDKNLD